LCAQMRRLKEKRDDHHAADDAAPAVLAGRRSPCGPQRSPSASSAVMRDAVCAND
jgi:hypothetical protein